MIAGAGVGIDAEALAHDALAGRDRLFHQRPHPALAIQLALPLGDDDLGTTRGSPSAPRAAP